MSQVTWKHSGLVGVSVASGIALTLVVQLGLLSFAPAFGSEAAKNSPPESWSMAGLNAMELNPLGKIDWITVEHGGESNSETTLFEGENVVSVWDSSPARLVFDTPSAYDEFVVVLKGELILTDNAGSAVTYKAGEMFMLKKGFLGTWEMTEDYRELIVVDTAAYNGA
ncbi:MAG: DUF861 domain-containing protein [Gammaproteobacteria bacterium]|jgi:uncharacterized cupin superfamily protein|nr:DUF861 domain-containing protein [Gammaproteobacteria bacterium]MBT5152863.1 DUF861 domain-containing protein [Gammaproteobacteria bacterium]MBT5684362.1 DUF861 domain-containing protein [Gammaproteobacteria bacterium]MBT5724247.1 DUF861 domain-containing protein [Gammaproteobacteria bacterium]MBT6585983.1 DUF861 domain-containing protein [Gammaproteobacteria bacterium]